jgi:hypothetical protein
MTNKMQKFTTDVFLLCDHTIFSQDGKFSIIGIFDRIFVTNLPATHPKMVVASIVSGPPNSECSFMVEFIEPDGQISKQNKPVTMNIKVGQNGKGNVSNEYIGFTVVNTGEYKVRLRINGDVIKEIPLYVQKVMKNESPGKPSN